MEEECQYRRSERQEGRAHLMITTIVPSTELLCVVVDRLPFAAAVAFTNDNDEGAETPLVGDGVAVPFIVTVMVAIAIVEEFRSLEVLGAAEGERREEEEGKEKGVSDAGA